MLAFLCFLIVLLLLGGGVFVFVRALQVGALKERVDVLSQQVVLLKKARQSESTEPIREREREDRAVPAEKIILPVVKARPDESPPPPVPAIADAASPNIQKNEKEVSPADTSREDSAVTPAFSFSWEYFVGAKLLAWVGGFTLFLGFCYFVKFTIERNLISYEVRVALTYLGGLLLMLLAEWLGRKSYSILSHTLSATGVVTLYLATTVARLVYSFTVFTTALTGALLVATTLLAFFMAVWKKAPVMAILGIIGGFITPVILSTGADHTVSLFCYISALNVALTGVALYRRWYYLPLLGLAGTLMLTAGWMASFFSAGHHAAFTLYLFFTLALYIGVFLLDRIKRGKTSLCFAIAAYGLIFLYYCLAAGLFIAEPRSFFGNWNILLLILFVTAPLLAQTLLAYLNTREAFHVPAGVLVHLCFMACIAGFLPLSGPGAWVLILITGAFYMALGTCLMQKADREPLWGNIPGAFLLSCIPAAFFLPVLSREFGMDPDTYFGLMPWATSFFLLLGLIFSRITKSAHIPLFLLLSSWMCYLFLPGGVRAEASFSFWMAGMAFVLLVFPFISSKIFLYKKSAWIASALALPVFYVFLREGYFENLPEVSAGAPGLPALLSALLYIPLVVYLTRSLPSGNPVRRGRLALYAGVMTGFVTLALGEQFRQEWLTIAFAMEGAALLWLNRRIPHRGLIWTGGVLLTISFFRFIVNPEVLSYHEWTGTAPWNWYLYAYLLVAACCFAGAKALQNLSADDEASILPKWMNAYGVILLFALINLEIADFYSRAEDFHTTFHFGYSLACDLTYSVGWGLYALVLLVFGFIRKARSARIAGICLLAVTLLKVFLYDLSALEQLYRVAALVTLAVIALIVSFLYQKFKNKLPMED